MPTMYLNGYDGSAVITGAGASLKSWSASFSRVVSDVTGYGDTGRRRRLGLPDLTGSAAGTMIADAASSKPNVNSTSRDGVQVTLSPRGAATVCQYTATCVISGISMQSALDGDQTVSFDFQLSGGVPPSESWDES